MTLKIKEEDLEHDGFDGGGSEKLKFKGEPFTGIMLVYEDDGWLSGEFEHQNGYFRGLDKPYFKNGQLEEEYYLHNNEVKESTYNKYNEEGNKLNIYS